MIAFEEKNQQHVSKTSRFLYIMVTSCLLPVTLKGEKLIFKILSWKTFLYTLLSFSWIVTALYLMFRFVHKIPFLSQFNERNFVTNLTNGFLYFLWIVGYLLPLFLSNGLSKFESKILLFCGHKWPKNGNKLVLGIGCHILQMKDNLFN